MNIADAREHKEHLCDVYPTADDVEHIGVIEKLTGGSSASEPQVFISGHPEYGGRWFGISEVETSCKLVTHYHRSEASNA